MRVLQLVDSLAAGGTERMAVNLSNALFKELGYSSLCCSREEGPLGNQLLPKVNYFYLQKKSTLDIRAIWRLYHFVKIQDIKVIHAHSSSFFTACLVKLFYPKVAILWHDHYGNSEALAERSKFWLKLFSPYFSASVAVNKNLQEWHENVLGIGQVNYLRNFAPKFTFENSSAIKMYGNNGTRIVCLANWRAQKDHLNLLKAFKQVVAKHQDWSLHLVGKQFDDGYQKVVYETIRNEGLEQSVYIYGSITPVFGVLQQCQIGVLPSKSEGLPLSLLEYGQAGLATVATDVGDCREVIIQEKTGLLVPPANSDAFAKALIHIIENPNEAQDMAKSLEARVRTKFSEQAYINRLLDIYQDFRLN